MKTLIDQIITGDCHQVLPTLSDESIHCVISDIPYGIGLDSWDVLHHNTNSALLGQSPAQIGKSGFKRRGKPINGWSAADRQIPEDYEQWCRGWADLLYPKLKSGASIFIFGARRTLHRALVALEDSGFLLKDILCWQKPNAHHRAQRLSGVLEKRGLSDEAKQWDGWRLGNLAPRWEPIAWLFKPYAHTITDNVLENGVGAFNAAITDKMVNVLEHWFAPDEVRFHEAQKPLRLIEYLIQLTTLPHQVVLDPFVGSGTTAVAAKRLARHYIGIEINPHYAEQARQRLLDCRPTIDITGSDVGQLSLFDVD